MDATKSQGQNQQNQKQQDDVQKHPVHPVSGPHREAGPIEAPVQDFLTPSEPELVLHPEVQEIGVETTKEKPELPQEVKQTGVEHAKESVPVQTQPAGTVTLPMNQQQATQTVQTNKKNTSKSVVWFATLILKLLKKEEEE